MSVYGLTARRAAVLRRMIETGEALEPHGRGWRLAASLGFKLKADEVAAMKARGWLEPIWRPGGPERLSLTVEGRIAAQDWRG